MKISELAKRQIEDVTGSLFLLELDDRDRVTYSLNISDLLKKWWDFMDEDCTAYRKEYTEDEQIDIINNFLNENN